MVTAGTTSMILATFSASIVSGTIHWLLHTAFPAPKQTGASPFVMELHRTRPVEGNYVESRSSHDETVVIGKEKSLEDRV